jgi:hypothetical protein
VTARSRPAIAVAALAALVTLALLPYAQTVSFGFTLDDSNTIVGHRGVKEPLSWSDIVLRDSWGRSRFDTIGIWRPVVTLTFWLDQHVAGGSAVPFHVSNLILYAALVVLGERFLARWCPALSDAARWLAMGAFAALAIHAGVVPSPTGRAEILAALFSLASIAAATCGQTLGARDILVSTVALLLAIESKESAAPIALLVPVLAHRAHEGRGALRRGPIVTLAIACVGVLALIAGFRALKMPFMDLGPDRALENPLLAVDAPHRWLGALDVLGFYVQHVFTGAGLGPDYSFSEPPILRDGGGGIALGGAVIVACVAILVTSWTRLPRLADATLGFGASYVAVSNVFLAASAIADRFFFFPSFWLIAIVAMGTDRAVKRPLARRVACVVVVAFALFQARVATAYAAVWRDDVTLLGRAARLYPNVFRTQRNLAHAFADEGRHDDAAFHLAAAEVLYAHYPVPVPRDAISPSWDGEPLAARLAHLRDAFGDPATCAATRTAAARVRSWGDAVAATELDTWALTACPP